MVSNEAIESLPPKSGSGRPSKVYLYAWVVFVFIASEFLGRALGVHFADTTLGLLYQYLDPEILRHDLLRGLYYLHAQPPLYNAYLGWILKLFQGFSSAAFALSYAAMGLGLLLAMAWLMLRLGIPRFITGILCLLFALLTPNFIAYTHWLAYTLPVAFFVTLCGVLLTRYADSGNRRWAHLFCWGAAILMLIRAVFHPLWLLLLLAMVVPLLPREKRKSLLMASLAPLLIVNAVYLKNYTLVGTYSGSSWLGLNLAKIWPISRAEMTTLRAEGKLPPVWHRRSFKEPAELYRFGYFQEGDVFVHTAIDAPFKSNGEPNFNHRDYAEISRQMLRGDLYLIRNYPARYLQRTVTAFLLYIQPGPNSVHFLVDYDFSALHTWRDTVTRFVFLGGRHVRPVRMLEPPLNLWLVGFPVLLIFGAYRVFRRGPEDHRGLRPIYAYFLVTVLWVTLTTNLIEIGENDRMRWEVEPLLTIWLGGATAAISRFIFRTCQIFRAL